jgi:hypothetical protein
VTDEHGDQAELDEDKAWNVMQLISISLDGRLSFPRRQEDIHVASNMTYEKAYKAEPCHGHE